MSLAVLAMALSALLAILLVVSRTPGMQPLFGLQQAFHTVLVLHVNFSVLVWLLAFAGVLWSLAMKAAYSRANTLAFSLASLGALFILISLFTDSALPIMSNYIPVLDTSIFLTGLSIFTAAISIMAVTVLMTPTADKTLRIAAIGWLVSVVLLGYHMLQLVQGDRFNYEQLFWGAGHLLQFVYLLLLLVVWNKSSGVESSIPARLALLPVAAALILGVIFDPASDSSRLAFTRLMEFGTPLLLLPALWLTLPRLRQVKDTALNASVGLMVLGVLIGILISDDTVTVTAHYHATNAAITVAFMGYAYRLLPGLGFTRPAAAACRWQLRLYTSGMTLYVMGMACSGWLGVPRKSAVVVDQTMAQITMGVMGIGGVISVVATLLFVGLMASAMIHRPVATLHKSMGELS
jgi:hypothetical protein